MMRPRRGVLVYVLITAALCIPPLAHARPGVVTTTDGQRFEGEIENDEQDANVVIVKVRGIPMRIEKSRVASTEYTEGFEKQFADKMAKLGPNDVNGRLALSREALNERQYVLARDAAEAARAIDPNNADAVAMLETIRSQMRLEQLRQNPPAGAASGTTSPATRDGAATEPATGPAAGDQKLLKPADINSIRQAELRADDRGVRIRYERDVSRRFMQYANIPPRDWNALTDNDKVQRILTQSTPEMRRDVHILNDPPVLFQYRRQVQPWVLQNCATSGCHGSGTNASTKLTLVQPGDSDAATYTNFYLLQRYRKVMKPANENVFAQGDIRVIDRQRPEQSLLIQYALPGSIAEQDHPDVQGYKPALRGLSDARHRLILDWINSLQPVEPDYGIVLDDADRAAQAATQPATTQAAPEATQPAPRGRPTTRPGGPRPPGAAPPPRGPAPR